MLLDNIIGKTPSTLSFQIEGDNRIDRIGQDITRIFMDDYTERNLVSGLSQRVNRAIALKQRFIPIWENLLCLIDPQSFQRGSRRYMDSRETKKKYLSTIGANLNNISLTMCGLLASESEKFISLSLKKQVSKRRISSIEKWCIEAEEALLNLFKEGRFFECNRYLTDSCLKLGDGFREMYETSDLLVYKNVPLEDSLLEIGVSGNITMIGKEFTNNLLNMFEVFGYDALPKDYDYDGSYEKRNSMLATEHEYFHVVVEGRDTGYMPEGELTPKYYGYLVDRSIQKLVSFDRYMYNPYTHITFMRSSSDIYGISVINPLENELENQSEISRMQRYNLAMLTSDPIGLRAGYEMPVSKIKPGQIIPDALDDSGNWNFRQLDIGKQINISEGIYGLKEKKLQEHLLIYDLLSTQDSPGMTVQEVEARLKARNDRISPILNSWNNDDVIPVIKNSLHYLMARGILNDFPIEDLTMELGDLVELYNEPYLQITLLEIKNRGGIGSLNAKYESNILSMLEGQIPQIIAQNPGNPDAKDLSIIGNLTESLRARYEAYGIDSSKYLKSKDELEAIKAAEAEAQAAAAEQARIQQMVSDAYAPLEAEGNEIP